MHRLFAWQRTLFSCVLSISFWGRPMGLRTSHSLTTPSQGQWLSSWVHKSSWRPTEKRKYWGSRGPFVFRKASWLWQKGLGVYLFVVVLNIKGPYLRNRFPQFGTDWSRQAHASQTRAAYIHVIGRSFLSPGSLWKCPCFCRAIKRQRLHHTVIWKPKKMARTDWYLINSNRSPFIAPIVK